MGKGGVTFDMWRQLSVDHVIPTSSLGHGGWGQVRERFPNLPKSRLAELHRQIDEINLVTACNFCNSMTSRMKPHSICPILPTARQDSAVSLEHPAVRGLLDRIRAAVARLRLEKRRYVSMRLAKLEGVFKREVELLGPGG
jgi:hypothetical protein